MADAAPAPGAAPELEWSHGDVPVSTLFDDPYFSRRDGRAEVAHVFLAGNGLPARWQHCNGAFTIAELGFGTGLNFVETWRTWLETGPPGGRLTFVSFEAYPLPPAAMRRALSAWPDLAPFADRLVAAWAETAGQPIQNAAFEGGVELQVVVGSASTTLPAWMGAADAWYLDGFSPAKNPDMWSLDLMRAVAAHTCPGGTFATYSAAGWVRRNLQEAGFEVGKRPGHGGKREMACGALRPSSPGAAETG